MSDSIVQALLEERAGYLAKGRRDRAAQVDAQLATFGVAVEAAVPARSDVETATPDKPKARGRGRA